MNIVIPDDYQDAVRGLDCFRLLAGHDVTVYHDTVTAIDALAERFADADALVLIRERTRVTAELLDRLPRLKLISQTGRGVTHIDVAACTQRGVLVCAGVGSADATAELTWGLVLAAMRHIPQEVARLKAGGWQSTLGLGLRGRTLGIFGYGKIGSIVAGYGRAFGMRVLVWGREGSLGRASADAYETATSQRALFAEADVVCLHVKLSAETRAIVTADRPARQHQPRRADRAGRAGRRATHRSSRRRCGRRLRRGAGDRPPAAAHG